MGTKTQDDFCTDDLSDWQPLHTDTAQSRGDLVDSSMRKSARDPDAVEQQLRDNETGVAEQDAEDEDPTYVTVPEKSWRVNWENTGTAKRYTSDSRKLWLEETNRLR